MLEHWLPTLSLCKVFLFFLYFFFTSPEGVRGGQYHFSIVQSNIWNIFIHGDSDIEIQYVVNMVAFVNLSPPDNLVFTRDTQGLGM